MSTFILKTDYDANIRQNRLDQLTEYEDTLLDKAEARAIALVKSYLKSRFDIATIFSKTGNNRDSALLGFTIDISVYYLWRLANARKVPDYAKEAYEQAIDWLTGVQAGDIVPDGLEKPTDGSKDLLTWGSNTKRNNNP